MLRWLALAFLLLNGVAFLWLSQQPTPQPTSNGVLPPQGEPLRLLTSDEAVGSSRLLAPAPGLEPLQIPAPSRTVCALIGPIASTDEARDVLGDQTDLAGFDAELVWRPVLLRTDYWVHLGPMSTREAALVRLRELHGAGIDSFIIQEGELTNAISLGYFTREELAQKSLAELRRQGLEASIRAIPRYERKLWLRLINRDGSALPQESLAQLIRNKNVGIEKNFCDVIATLEKFE